MKKIISALTLGAMICGAAFADVSLNLNYRQRANMFTNANGKNNTHTLFEDAYSGNGTDNFTASLSGDIASFDMVLVGDEAKTSLLRAKTLGASLFIKDLSLFAGFWSDGKVNGAYRVKSDADAGNLEGMDFEFKKLGSAYAGSPNFFMDNMVLPVNVTASESYAVGATYNVALSNGAVKINGVYISNETSDEKGSASSGALMGHTGVLLVDGRLDGIGQAEAVVKYGQTKTADTEDGGYLNAAAFGAYVQPTITRNLILTVGGAGSVIDGDFTDYSVDLRARYQFIPKKLSVSSFHSFSAINDADKNAAKLNGKGNATTKGIANDGVVTKGDNKGTVITRDQVMSNNIIVRYNVNDKFSVFAIAADMIGMGKNAGVDVVNSDGDKNKNFVELRFSGWAQFFANPNCSVTTGLVCEIYDATEYLSENAMYNWALPVVVRVKM